MEPTIEQPITEPQAVEARPRSLVRHIFRNGWQYFFQFFMLFLAVAAGFFADNLREDFGDRKQAKQYAASMANDVRRDSMNIVFQIATLRTAVQKIDALANYVRGKKIGELNNLDVYRYTMISPNPAFRWSRATLEQIKNSGSLRNFSDDSVSMYIARYDALTLHLDQDNIDDQQLYRRAAELQNLVVDMNYPEDIQKQISTRSDSLASTQYALPLLTTDINDVRKMVNAYLLARDHCVGRIAELQGLQHDQVRLMRLLKREFHK